MWKKNSGKIFNIKIYLLIVYRSIIKRSATLLKKFIARLKKKHSFTLLIIHLILIY